MPRTLQLNPCELARRTVARARRAKQFWDEVRYAMLGLPPYSAGR